MATLLSDDFNRANSVNVVGAPQIGPTPTVDNGAMGITSNQLYTSTTVGHVNWDLGTPNVELSCTMNLISTSVAVGLVLGFSGTASDYILASALTNGVTLFRNGPGGLMSLVVSSIKNPAANGSVMRIHQRDQVVRVYIDNVLIIRHYLDYPMTATKHGFRIATTTPRADNVLGTDAPVIAEDPKTGEVRDDRAGGPAVNPLSFVYRGRDTKTQDQTAGA